MLVLELSIYVSRYRASEGTGLCLVGAEFLVIPSVESLFRWLGKILDTEN